MIDEFEKKYQGVWKTCDECGKMFFVAEVGSWAFKRNRHTKASGNSTLYFCKWSCMRKFDARREGELKDIRKKAAESFALRKRSPYRCVNCIHNKVTSSSKRHYCELDKDKYVYPKKEACINYIGKEDANGNTGQEVVIGRPEEKAQ